METKLESRRLTVQQQFDAFTKEKEDLTEQGRKLQQRIGEINVELLRLQGRFSELQELENVEKVEKVDRGEEKIAEEKK